MWMKNWLESNIQKDAVKSSLSKNNQGSAGVSYEYGFSQYFP